MPEFAKATPEEILASPAWTMPCRLGDRQCIMRLDGIRPSETLDLAIRLEDESHVLSFAPSPSFPELSAIWPSRADVPEAILLALVEKDCGKLLQLVENAVRRQLKIEGLAPSDAKTDAKQIFAQIIPTDGNEPLLSFALDASPAILSALGQLRFIDTSNDSIRSISLPAEIEYASFQLSETDAVALAAGDSLLLPEVGSVPPRVIASHSFALGGTGVVTWEDDGLARICAADAIQISLGTLFDAEGNGATDGRSAPNIPAVPPENAALKLVRQGKTLASGRFVHLAGAPAFSIDAVMRP